MEFQTAVAASAKYDIILKDLAGDVVTSPNAITAASSDDTIATVVVDPSYTFLTVTTTGKAGSATVTVLDSTDAISTTLSVVCTGVPASISLVLAS